MRAKKTCTCTRKGYCELHAEPFYLVAKYFHLRHHSTHRHNEDRPVAASVLLSLRYQTRTRGDSATRAWLTQRRQLTGREKRFISGTVVGVFYWYCGVPTHLSRAVLGFELLITRQVICISVRLSVHQPSSHDDGKYCPATDEIQL